MDEEIIVETEPQLALNILSEHLLDPCWQLRHKKGLNDRQRNTILINQLFKKYPSRIEKFPWMVKQIIKSAVEEW